MTSVSAVDEQGAVERTAEAERQVLDQVSALRQRVEALDLESVHQDRRALPDVEGDVRVALGADDGGVDLSIEKAVQLVEQPEPRHIAAELALIEPPLLAETEPADAAEPGEPARVGGRDRCCQDEGLERVISREAELADHQSLLDRLGRKAGRGGEPRHRQREHGPDDSHSERPPPSDGARWFD